MKLRAFMWVVAALVPSLSIAASCPNPWKPDTSVEYDPIKQVLVYDGIGLAARDKRPHERQYRSDRPPVDECRSHRFDFDRAGVCKCFEKRYGAQQAAELANAEQNRRAVAAREEQMRRDRETDQAIMGTGTRPVEPRVRLTAAQIREAQERGAAIVRLLAEIGDLKSQNRTVEAEAKERELAEYLLPRSNATTQGQHGSGDRQDAARPGAQGAQGAGLGAGSQPGSTAAAGAAAVPPRVYVHLPDDGSLRLTGGPTSQACSAFVADVDVRSQIDRTIRSAAPRVQMVADGSGTHRIGVGQFSWECFRKYPDWGMTIRLTLSASPSSIGAGGEVSGERTVFGPGASECFTIECAAQKHRREFNPLVEGLAGELANKLVAQLQPTAPPAGVAITPAQFAQAPSGNAGREPGSVLGGTPSAGAGATGQGGGSGRLDSSTVGRVNTSSYWCNSLGGQGGGDSSNEECVVPVPPVSNACSEMERFPDLDQRVIRDNGPNNVLARLHAANRAARCDASVPLPEILNNLVQWRWESFRGVDAGRGEAGERACDPQVTGWHDAGCDRQAYALYFIHACAAQRCIFEKR